MSKRNFDKEEPKPKVKSGMPGAYYAALGRPERDGVWAEQLPRMSPAEIEKQKAHSRRADLIKEIAGRKM
jgi:hypothetical protein